MCDGFICKALQICLVRVKINHVGVKQTPKNRVRTRDMVLTWTGRVEANDCTKGEDINLAVRDISSDCNGR